MTSDVLLTTERTGLLHRGKVRDLYELPPAEHGPRMLMVAADRLFEPIFTPSSKAVEGHDEPITYEQVEALVGPERAHVMRLRSLALYRYAAEVALERGIIIADTKFEFGMLDGEVTLIDECL